MKTVAECGEFGVIARIRDRFSDTRPEVLVGIGDDTATLRFEDRPLILTTDTMVESVHFRCDWSSPEQIAIKLLSSNLSDLASKAADPVAMTLNLGLPGSTELAWLDSFLDSLAQQSQAFRIDLVGGDTVRSESIVLTLTAWGYQTTEEALSINAAQPGDMILVTGTQGDATAGFRLLDSGENRPGNEYLLKRFHEPMPRVHEAIEITQIITPTAMTDISDGLARDLPKVCAASGVGARLQREALPISDALRNYAGNDAEALAWQGGEEYELLFTASSQDAEKLLAAWGNDSCPITSIGTITPEHGIAWNGQPITGVSGFDHFG